MVTKLFLLHRYNRLLGLKRQMVLKCGFWKYSSCSKRVESSTGDVSQPLHNPAPSADAGVHTRHSLASSGTNLQLTVTLAQSLRTKGKIIETSFAEIQGRCYAMARFLGQQLHTHQRTTHPDR